MVATTQTTQNTSMRISLIRGRSYGSLTCGFRNSLIQHAHTIDETIAVKAPNTARPARNQSARVGSTTTLNIKPLILESKIADPKNFLRLSDGFKKVFSNDEQDRKMMVPISGYDGHLRGRSSQNFFGKSFREMTLQSKLFERQQKVRLQN